MCKINYIMIIYDRPHVTHDVATKWILTKFPRCDGINLPDKSARFECSEPGDLFKIHLIAILQHYTSGAIHMFEITICTGCPYPYRVSGP